MDGDATRAVVPVKFRFECVDGSLGKTKLLKGVGAEPGAIVLGVQKNRPRAENRGEFAVSVGWRELAKPPRLAGRLRDDRSHRIPVDKKLTMSSMVSHTQPV